MAGTEIIYPSAGSYGWSTSESNVHSSSAKDTLVVGNTVNSSGNRRPYGSSLKFNLSDLSGDNSVVALKKIILHTTKTKDTPYTSGINVYVNEKSTPYWHNSGLEETSPHDDFSSSACELTNIRSLIQDYANNGVSFYLHIINPYGTTAYGGYCRGYSPKSTYSSQRPYLEVEWDYANSTGKLNTTSFNVGTTVTFTLNVKGTNYYHDISCKINGADSGIDFSSLTSSAFTNTDITSSFSLEPTLEQVKSWFGTDKTSANGIITIKTYDDSEKSNKIGDEATVNFTLKLTQSYLNGLGGYVPNNSINFIHQSVTTVERIIAGYSLYNVTSEIKENDINEAFSLANHTIQITNSYKGVVTKNFGSNLSVEMQNVVLGTEELEAKITLKDNRGYSYTKTISQEEINFFPYSLPKVEAFSLYRVKESEGDYIPATDGNYLGGEITITLCDGLKGAFGIRNLAESNDPIKKRTGQKGTITFILEDNSTIEGSDTYGIYEIDTKKSYTFTLSVSDTVLASGLYNYPEGNNVKATFTVSKSEFILHIVHEDNSGEGIGLMTAGEVGYITLGKPVKGLQIFNAGTGGNFDFSNITSKSNFCDAIGAVYNDDPSQELSFSTINLNQIKSKTSANQLMNYEDSILNIGNKSTSLNLIGENIYFNINNTSYCPTYEYNAGDTVEYTVENFSLITNVNNLSHSAADFYGYLTTSQTRLYITINLARPIHVDRIDGVNFTSFYALIRSGGTYTLANSWSGCTDSNNYFSNKAINYLSYLNSNSSKICFDSNGYATQITVCFASDNNNNSNINEFYGTNNGVSICSALDIQFTFTKGSTTGVYK